MEADIKPGDSVWVKGCVDRDNIYPDKVIILLYSTQLGEETVERICVGKEFIRKIPDYGRPVKWMKKVFVALRGGMKRCVRW